MDKPCAGKIVVVALLASLVGSALSAQDQDKALKKIRWGVTSMSASNWIPWIAKDMKIYEKNGLDIEMILVKGSGQTSPAIIGGSLFAAPVRGDASNDGQSRRRRSGQHRAHGARSAEQMLVKQEIRKAEDIKGKRVATSGLGSLGDFMFHVIMRKYGLNPDTDIIWITVGTPPERLQALAAGSVDAADLSYPIGCAGRNDGLSSALGCARRGRLSVDVGGDAQKNYSRRPRRRDADDARPMSKAFTF